MEAPCSISSFCAALSQWWMPAASPVPASASIARNRRSASRSSGWRRMSARCCCTGTARTCARPKPVNGCSPMRGGCSRSPRRHATCCASPTAKVRSGSASPRILRRINWQNCWATFSRSHPGLRLDVRADQSKNLARDLERGELDLALFKREAGEKGAIAVWPEQVHWVTSKSHPIDVGRRLGTVDRFSARLPLPCRRHPRAGERGPHLAHVLHLIEPCRHPGRGRRRHGTEHPVGDVDPDRSPRADGEGRLCADQPDGGRVDGRAEVRAPQRCG